MYITGAMAVKALGGGEGGTIPDAVSHGGDGVARRGHLVVQVLQRGECGEE
jgi:hypothetical protein